jgi:iron complex outermembrane receptor protein
LQQNRFNLETEHNRDWGKVSLQASRNNYAHDEIEGGNEIATRFRQKLDLIRGQWSGKLSEDWNNVAGFQLERRQLSALGEESFMPRTTGLKQSLFTVNEIHLDHNPDEENFEQKKMHQHRFEWGLRYDNQIQNRLNNFVDNIGGNKRAFGLLSGAMGWQNALNNSWNIGVQTSYQEKAPSLEELYGNGPHLATGTFEVGKQSLNKEKSQNIEVSIGRHWFSLNNNANSPVANTLNINQANAQNNDLKNNDEAKNYPFAWKLTSYIHRVYDYIYANFQDNDGNGIADTTNVHDHDLTNLNYTQDKAYLYGWEWEWNQRLNQNWSLNGFVDYTRGKVSGVNIPRLIPLRSNIAVNYNSGKWFSRFSVLTSRSQNKVGALETKTAGYTQLNAMLQYAIAKNFTVFLEGKNLTNQEIRLHSSLRKDDIPQMGRTVWLGLRGNF